MEGFKKLKPKKGTIVRDPLTMAPLAEEGDIKPWSGPDGRYWRRKVNTGECSIIDENNVHKAQSDFSSIRRKFDKEGEK